MSVGRDAAAAGRIVTFGIPPTAPKTNYGYIRRGGPLDIDGCYAVAALVEKPDAATATGYVADGCLWNSGNFLFRANTLLSELAQFEPAIGQAAATAVDRTKTDLGFVQLDAEAFEQAPQTSIDYALTGC